MASAKDLLRERSPGAWAFVQRGANLYYSLHPVARRRHFERIYRDNVWGDAESRSGSGSNSAESAAIGAELPALFARHEIRTLLDVPCGDFHWMRQVAPQLERYIGGDIVAELIERLRREEPQYDFRVIDLLKDELPTADAVLARDVLVHCSNRDVAQALTNIRGSGIDWLLTTTFPEHANVDIITGRWRPLNLQAPPFSLPPPVELITESTGETDYPDRSLGLWRIADLR